MLIIFFHGTAYSPEDAVLPGWLFYASTQFNPRNPIWRDLPELNTYITRCQSFLQALTMKHGRLQTGSTSYRAVVVPSCRYIPVETVKVLADIAAKGIPVIYHADVPTWDVPGYAELKKRRAVLKVQIKQLTDASAFEASRDVAAPLRSAGVKPESLQVGTGLGCVRRRLDDGRMVYFVVNRGKKDFYGWVRLAVDADSVAIMYS